MTTNNQADKDAGKIERLEQENARLTRKLKATDEHTARLEAMTDQWGRKIGNLARRDLKQEAAANDAAAKEIAKSEGNSLTAEEKRRLDVWASAGGPEDMQGLVSLRDAGDSFVAMRYSDLNKISLSEIHRFVMRSTAVGDELKPDDLIIMLHTFSKLLTGVTMGDAEAMTEKQFRAVIKHLALAMLTVLDSRVGEGAKACSCVSPLCTEHGPNDHQRRVELGLPSIQEVAK